MKPYTSDTNNTPDRYDIVLHLIEHPDEYSPGQMKEILSDPETREIYNLLSRADSAVEAHRSVDIDAEWRKFALTHAVRPHRRLRPGANRAASIAVIILTSLVAVAAGIVFAVEAFETQAPEKHIEVPGTDGEALLSEVPEPTQQPDSINTSAEPVLFEDATLRTIMETVAARYGVEVRYTGDKAANLHLFYRLDPMLSLDDVIAQLNTFEQINIRRDGNILTID